MLAKADKNSIYRDLVKAGYKDSFLEALTSFQALEDLLKVCIRTSDYILNKSSHKSITYSPKRSDLDKVGLGTLAEIFKTFSKNKNLCKNIKELSKERNLLAHSELLPTLKLSFTDEQIKSLQHRTVDIKEIADTARKLYLELVDEYQKLLVIKAEVKNA